ncbi:16S rRNA (cytidine(1402)-2'-O)-methyltransferase [Roseinatronobacter alkalisoli]|uniref:Ribosomal RNA small subunit methyltransferase I n=1 Tax=Roseinatronobacter alkalisoli TaxID=3028235 RepID=A0ABT5T632_9RHOB|nr:16S rRNA (cytidine(1402)-2'-O)-methyltransferase [Roseinatronobacter sp. HJB301]MDD7970574.1 16S rRNA (cytidine(1402)-2'-O)-methyltransferase [Roseinatronobacter sp. HJB301]
MPSPDPDQTPDPSDDTPLREVDPTILHDARAHDTRSARPVPPGLHLIATPIGAARDITLHALDLLAGADILAAEDTRSLRKLMEIHAIPVRNRPVLAYHDHNGAAMRPRISAALEAGKSIVYASEAGTPLVADPGFQLARSVISDGYPLHSAPGPSAVLAALTVAGLPSDRFCFMGFAPAQGGARKHFLNDAANIPATLIFYESPKRIHRFLTELCEIMGPDRQAALCRELTKKHEEVLRMTLGEMADVLADRSMKGEIVLVVDRAPPVTANADDLDHALARAMADMTLKEAVAHVTAELGLPRRVVYQAALARGKAQ